MRAVTKILKVERPRKKHRKYAWADTLNVSAMSPLARYVHENLADDLTIQELIEQFQEYDCEHRWYELAISVDKVFTSCEICGLIKKRAR